MTTIESVDYKYFGIAIVFLILTYYYLINTKTHIYRKKIISNNFDDKFYVMTSKGLMTMDNNILEKYMNKVKTNIKQMQNNFDSTKCGKLKKYLDDAKIQAKKYIELNKNDIDKNFCNLDMNVKIINDNMLKEREILKNKINRKTEMDNDDSADDLNNSDNIKYDIMELLNDIDIMLFLVRSSICKKGNMDLSAIDKVVLELYRTNCSYDVNYKAEISQLSKNSKGHIKEGFDAILNIMSDTSAEKISRSVLSQDIHDSDIQLKKETYNRAINNQGDSILTHVNEDFQENQINMGVTNPTEGVKNTDKWHQIYNMANNDLRDKNSRESLL